MPQDHTDSIKNRLALVNRKYGRWTILAVSDEPRKVVARCDCGKIRSVTVSNITRGVSNSCGCLAREKSVKTCRTHGLRNNRVYKVWNSMVQRCHNGNSACRKRYHDRGIIVCERWRKSFMAFIEDMGMPPSKEHSIDRIDNDGNYEPGNCRWATRSEQARNRSTTRMLTLGDQTLCIKEWSKRTGIMESVIRQRIDRQGWSVEKALTYPVGMASREKYTFPDNCARGERSGTAKLNRDQVREIRSLRKEGVKLNDLADRYGVSFGTISNICCRDTWQWLDPVDNE